MCLLPRRIEIGPRGLWEGQFSAQREASGSRLVIGRAVWLQDREEWC